MRVLMTLRVSSLGSHHPDLIVAVASAEDLVHREAVIMTHDQRTCFVTLQSSLWLETLLVNVCEF